MKADMNCKLEVYARTCRLLTVLRDLIADPEFVQLDPGRAPVRRVHDMVQRLAIVTGRPVETFEAEYGYLREHLRSGLFVMDEVNALCCQCGFYACGACCECMKQNMQALLARMEVRAAA